jgi:hypothetical protein
MELPLGWILAAALFLMLLLPFLIYAQRRGKAHGHTMFTWNKPRGHSDIGPDVGGQRQTGPGHADRGRGMRY